MDGKLATDFIKYFKQATENLMVLCLIPITPSGIRRFPDCRVSIFLVLRRIDNEFRYTRTQMIRWWTPLSYCRFMRADE